MTPHATTRGFTVREFKPFERNTLRGFLSLELPSGLVLHNCTLHEKNGSRWVSMPVREFQKDGERSWMPLVDFADKESRQVVQEYALEAIDEYLGKEGE
jgi:DNA-binding cell septation regulator SpoVG